MSDTEHTDGRPEQWANHTTNHAANHATNHATPESYATSEGRAESEGRPGERLASDGASATLPSSLGGVADAMPLASLADQALEQRLLTDGANWRARSPGVRRVGATLDERIELLMQSHAMRQAPTIQRQPTPAAPPALSTRRLSPREATAQSPSYDTSHPTRGGYSMPKGRLRGFAAAAIMLLLIAVFATLVFTRLPQHGSHTTAQMVSQPGAQVAPIGKWQSIDALTAHTAVNSANAPAIAPSNPKVVYETLNGTDGQGYTQAALRRTTTGGSTWQSVALPATVNPQSVNAIMVFVSPFNAQVVFLGLSNEAATNCTPGNSANGDRQTATPLSASIGATSAIGATHSVHLSGYGWCTQEFRSVNGGATWAPMTFPVPGALTSIGLNPPVLAPQGNRLYSTIGCISSSCTRLVVSSDDGATWQTTDDSIVAAGQGVCDFAATPDGQTIFADTASGQNCYGATNGSAVTYTLWRSDDAGASWSAVGALPRGAEHGMLVVSRGAGQEPLLYVDMPTITGYSTDKMGDKLPIYSLAASDLGVSADGGQTWSYAPEQGAPSNLVVYYGPLGTLSDGSIIMPFIAKNWQTTMNPLTQTFYVWQRGDHAWRQLAPPTPAENVYNLLAVPTAAGKGHDTLWLIAGTDAAGPTDQQAYYILRDQL